MHTVIETSYFIRTTEKLLNEAEREKLIHLLASNTHVGVLVKGTRAIRKVRFGRDNMGKRGGARVIYFFHNDTMPLVALAVYAKNAKDDLSEAEKQELNAIADAIIKQFKGE